MFSPTAFLRRFRPRNYVFYVFAPAYDPLSGGIRVLNLLVHHLNRQGFEAFTTLDPRYAKSPFPVPYLTPSIRLEHARTGRIPIMVYPEAVIGNPYYAQFVARYLLNAPGLLVPGAELAFGPRDYFITYAPEHAPAAISAIDLFIPLVDRNVYFPPYSPARRRGFIAFMNHADPDLSTMPEWLQPCLVVSRKTPRSHAELGDLYRTSEAMVTWERTSAIYEALSCGCPVICIPNRTFNQATYQLRFGGAGLVWGWEPELIAAAAEASATFRAIHERAERDVGEIVRDAFERIRLDVDQRLRNERIAPPYISYPDIA